MTLWSLCKPPLGCSETQPQRVTGKEATTPPLRICLGPARCRGATSTAPPRPRPAGIRDDPACGSDSEGAALSLSGPFFGASYIS